MTPLTAIPHFRCIVFWLPLKFNKFAHLTRVARPVHDHRFVWLERCWYPGVMSGWLPASENPGMGFWVDAERVIADRRDVQEVIMFDPARAISPSLSEQLDVSRLFQFSQNIQTSCYSVREISPVLTGKTVSVYIPQVLV
ncbi:hypothetical protein MVEN_01294900 [Mycena venus]|uniref:Uncharacterized protein n=1 Tax=Mycena venus TaxID=2733690 RepID=A0A8H6Y0W3_9AGAR|nr:hypothetical protein MVEN_01294900 [Mycena venus]